MGRVPAWVLPTGALPQRWGAGAGLGVPRSVGVTPAQAGVG